MLLKLENKFSSIKELIFPLAGGFSVALLQIILMDLGRLFLTGSISILGG